MKNNGNSHDNNAIVAQIVSLRVEKANLFGFKTFADYALERTMPVSSMLPINCMV